MKIQLKTVFYVTFPPQIFNSQIIKTGQLALPLDITYRLIIYSIISTLIFNRSNIFYHNIDITTSLFFIQKYFSGKDQKVFWCRHSNFASTDVFYKSIIFRKRTINKEVLLFQLTNFIIKNARGEV